MGAESRKLAGKGAACLASWAGGVLRQPQVWMQAPKEPLQALPLACGRQQLLALES